MSSLSEKTEKLLKKASQETLIRSILKLSSMDPETQDFFEQYARQLSGSSQAQLIDLQSLSDIKDLFEKLKSGDLGLLKVDASDPFMQGLPRMYDLQKTGFEEARVYDESGILDALSNVPQLCLASDDRQSLDLLKQLSEIQILVFEAGSSSAFSSLSVSELCDMKNNTMLLDEVTLVQSYLLFSISTDLAKQLISDSHYFSNQVVASMEKSSLVSQMKTQKQFQDFLETLYAQLAGSRTRLIQLIEHTWHMLDPLKKEKLLHGSSRGIYMTDAVQSAIAQNTKKHSS